jgi:predicted hydrocarbon binding protein
MFELFNKLILARKLDFKRGEISLFGTNICLIPPEIYLEFIKELERVGEQEVVYESSFNSARLWFGELSRKNSKITKNELIDFVPKILNLLAVGKVEIVESDLVNKIFKVNLDNSLIAEIYGKSSSPVDLQFSGYLAGAFSFIFKEEMKCIEEKCLARGDKSCQFVIAVKGG